MGGVLLFFYPRQGMSATGRVQRRPITARLGGIMESVIDNLSSINSRAVNVVIWCWGLIPWCDNFPVISMHIHPPMLFVVTVMEVLVFSLIEMVMVKKSKVQYLSIQSKSKKIYCCIKNIKTSWSNRRTTSHSYIFATKFATTN